LTFVHELTRIITNYKLRAGGFAGAEFFWLKRQKKL